MPPHDRNREFAIEVVRRLKQAGYEALWAGGCVRDFLLGKTPKDYDVATDARPEEVRKLFGHRRTLAVGASFGVILVLAPKGVENVEVATFRTEGRYLDGRRPERVAFTSAEEDARRRDFTINGLFYDPIEQRVLDFVGGEKDLADGIVRAIGDPQARMSEDKLRMLRAVRFAAALEFELDEATAEAIRDMAGEMTVVSAERIADELRRMLVDRHRMRAVRLCAEVGLLAVIVPELKPILPQKPGFLEKPGVPPSNAWERTLHMLNLLQEPGFELAAAALLHALGTGDGRPPSKGPPPPSAEGANVRELCRRLRLSNGEVEHIGWLVDHQNDLEDASRLPLSKLKRILAHRWARDLLALHRAKALASGTDLSAVVFCDEFLQRTPAEEIDPPPLMTGEDLIALGLKPGPRFKEILDAVRDAQLNNEITSHEEAIALAKQLADE